MLDVRAEMENYNMSNYTTYRTACMACNWVDINWTKRAAGDAVIEHQTATGHAVTTDKNTVKVN